MGCIASRSGCRVVMGKGLIYLGIRGDTLYAR